jgi:hypothetical protein
VQVSALALTVEDDPPDPPQPIIVAGKIHATAITTGLQNIDLRIPSHPKLTVQHTLQLLEYYNARYPTSAPET